MMINNRDNGTPRVSQFLPQGWEKAYDEETNRYFYLDHNMRATTWINPLDRDTKPRTPAECYGDQLPFGWERIDDPVVGTYYASHLEKRNQWKNPVDQWHKLNQNHYSNSHHLLSNQQTGNSLDSNNQTNSLTTASKPDISLQVSDNEQSATSLNNSATLDTEIIDSLRSNNSTKGSKYDASLLDIMDNCFSRESSHSVEV